jgi:hypothetical protein
MINLRRIMGWQPDLELKEDEYRRPPRIRAGELELEAQSGVVDWRPRQRWTTQAPTRPGYYWCRPASGSARIVEVFSDYGTWRMAGIGWGPINVPTDGLLWGTLAISEPEGGR